MDLRASLESHLGDVYAIERELGGGGMSRVFVATERRLGRPVVIKLLDAELAATLSATRFEREIRMAASLQQANIVPVLTAGLVDGVPYYTMPFIEGESLRARLAHGPLAEAQVISILRDVARALAHAHGRGIIHRDIKPDNVLLSGGAAVVTDFGIAKAISDAQASPTPNATGVLTQVGTAIGTPAYMAPEQAMADPAMDHRADLYALGCMAYELLTGAAPFHGRPPHKLMAAHLTEEATAIDTMRPGVDPALAAIVDGCMAKDPSRRPADADGLLRQLDALRSGEARQAVPAVLATTVRSLPALLAGWGALMGAAWLLARAAVLDIGLPLWTIPLVVGVSALGVPAILVTWYVQRVARQAVLQTPVRTPGGTPTTRGTVATLALRASPHVSWRGTARVGLATAALLVVSITAVMVLRLYGLGPAASLMAAGRIGADSRVLVARFAATGTDSSLGAVVAQGFRTSLAQSRAIRLVDASEVAAGFRRMTLPDSTPLTDPVARELAEREGIPLLVTGTVAPLGAGFLVTASLVRTDSGTVLTSEQGGADAPRELVATIDEIARALRARIGESLRDVARARRLEEATTPSLEALREYTRAVELASVEGRWPEAIRHLRTAVREDTAFASAWRTLSVYLNNLGERRGEVLRAAEQAYRHRDRTDGAERRSIEAGYLRWVDVRGAIQLLASTAEGNETTAYARLLREVGQAARSESVQVAAIARMKAANRPLSNLTYANVITSRLVQGKVADARHALRQMREEFPTGYFTDAAEVWVGWVDGGPDSLPHLIAQARRSVMPSTWTLAARLEASLAMMRGQHRRVGALIARGEALADSSGTSPDPVSWAMSAILARALHTGDLPRGVRALDSLRRANPEVGMDPADAHLLEFASAFARLGASERGAPLLAEFQRTASRDRRLARLGEVHHAMGDLALARGDAAQALAMYRRAAQTDSGRPADPFSVDWRERMGRAFDALGARDSAAAYYDWVAEHRDFKGYVHAGVHLPVVLRRLGLLYREMGDVARARLVTARLLALWRDADPELAPAVADVRTTLTALPR